MIEPYWLIVAFLVGGVVGVVGVCLMLMAGRETEREAGRNN